MNSRTYIVTGGGGFVGKALCLALRAADHQVISISRGEYPELRDAGVRCVRADLGKDLDSWASAFEGVDGVFHTAAKVDMWGKREAFVQANVIATRNVVAACKRYGVSNVVFTSSPSVVHTGRDLINVDESIPLASHFSAFYPETKAMAESEILAEAGDTLKVTALRPHLIWGPNDTNLIPAVLTRARSGALKRVGDGINLVDLTFIDDCVHAHLCAMRTLETSPERCNGKAYFISQGDPVSLWGWIDDILTVHGLPKVTKSVPLPLALKVAAVCEAISRTLLKFGIEYPPRFSSFLVTEMATSHYFDISAARRDLGYSPSCTIAEAMQKTFSL